MVLSNTLLHHLPYVFNWVETVYFLLFDQLKNSKASFPKVKQFYWDVVQWLANAMLTRSLFSPASFLTAASCQFIPAPLKMQISLTQLWTKYLLKTLKKLKGMFFLAKVLPVIALSQLKLNKEIPFQVYVVGRQWLFCSEFPWVLLLLDIPPLISPKSHCCWCVMQFGLLMRM